MAGFCDLFSFPRVSEGRNCRLWVCPYHRQVPSHAWLSVNCKCHNTAGCSSHVSKASIITAGRARRQFNHWWQLYVASSDIKSCKCGWKPNNLLSQMQRMEKAHDPTPRQGLLKQPVSRQNCVSVFFIFRGQLKNIQLLFREKNKTSC